MHKAYAAFWFMMLANVDRAQQDRLIEIKGAIEI